MKGTYMSRKDVVQMWRNMAELQWELNNFTNGEYWISAGKTAKGKSIDWSICIKMELMELLNSLPWKHWKDVDQEPDLNNINIELVDIIHFYLSYGLERSRNILLFMNTSREPEKHEVIDYFVNVFNTYCEQERIIIPEKNNLISLMILTIKDILENRIDIYTGLDKLMDINALLQQVSFKDLYNIYCGKYCLNKVRQERGYQEGTYIKQWKLTSSTGEFVEDNVVMNNLLLEEPDVIDIKVFYNKLLKYYDDYVAK